MIATLFAIALSLAASSEAVPCAAAAVAASAAAVAHRSDAALAELAPRLQDDEELPDKREDIKALLEELGDHVKARGKEDNEAIAVIDRLVQEFPRCGPKDRASIVKALGKCFEAKRRDLEDGVPDNKLFMAAAVALGEMGKDASATIAKWIGDKRHRKDLMLQRQLVLSLGKVKDLKQLDELVDLLEDKDATLVAAAAEALSNFKDAPQETRKTLVNELIKVLMSAKGAMDSNLQDTIARERYDAIAASIITTLQELTGVDERVPEKWQSWWNNNKKKDWDEELDR